MLKFVPFQSTQHSGLYQHERMPVVVLIGKITEGSGEFSTNEKSRFYRMAKRSATETAAILDVSKRLNIVHKEHYKLGRDLLIRIVMMLTKMAQKSD